MAETFHGAWTLYGGVVPFVVEGSDASDGTHTDAGPLEVSGAEWTVDFKGGLEPGRRMSSTLQKGLVVEFTRDPNPPGQYVLLTCYNADPALTPWLPIVNGYDFSLPRGILARREGHPH